MKCPICELFCDGVLPISTREAVRECIFTASVDDLRLLPTTTESMMMLAVPAGKALLRD